jgi:hypothetical protein
MDRSSSTARERSAAWAVIAAMTPEAGEGSGLEPAFDFLRLASFPRTSGEKRDLPPVAPSSTRGSPERSTRAGSGSGRRRGPARAVLRATPGADGSTSARVVRADQPLFLGADSQPRPQFVTPESRIEGAL